MLRTYTWISIAFRVSNHLALLKIKISLLSNVMITQSLLSELTSIDLLRTVTECLILFW